MVKRRWVLALAVAATLAAGPVVYAADSMGQDTPVDALMDWSATFGKKGAEKDAMIAQRKAERAAKAAEKQGKKAAKAAEKQGKKAGKEMDKAGKGLKKGLKVFSN